VQTTFPATVTVGRITGVKPFTTYNCTIHAVADTAGLYSDPVIVTTLQQG